MTLSPSSVATLPASIERYGYDRDRVTAGIVHLGIGAFHRAHQAVYVDDLLGRDPTWGIVGASLRSADTAEALNPQGGLYTVAVRADEATRLRVIGSVLQVLVASHAREELLAAMTDPGVRIVTLTVTEKGYCHDPATGELDEQNAGIRRDLADPTRPQTTPGLLVEALARRRRAGVPPFTVLCCDNLPANGRTVKRIVARFAALRDSSLGHHVEHEVAFPCSMVDRIVPATTDDDRAAVNAALGDIDAWPVMTEPFTQWVVEDNFPTGRPAFEDAGVEMVEDVEPFELMKLRMLNGSHSTMAYLGALAGYETVADVMADPDFERLIRDLMTEEVMPTLSVPGIDLAAYRDALIARFKNRGLRHRTHQIAMDGSQKLPQRLLGTIRDRLAAGAPIDRLALGVAAWMAYATGTDEAGRPIDVRDPLASRLKHLAEDGPREAGRIVAAFAGIADIFDPRLAADPRFRDAVTAALARLFADGARRTVATTVAGAAR